MCLCFPPQLTSVASAVGQLDLRPSSAEREEDSPLRLHGQRVSPAVSHVVAFLIATLQGGCVVQSVAQQRLYGRVPDHDHAAHHQP